MKKIDFINERSDYSKQILNKIPSFYLRFGNIFLFIFLIIIILIGFLIKYPDVINSEIEIVENNPPIKLISRTEGSIDFIIPNNNDYVKKNTWIALIKNSAKTSDILKLDSIFFLNKNKYQTLPDNLEVGDLQITYNTLLKKNEEYNYYIKYIPNIKNIKSNNLSKSNIDLTKNILIDKIETINLEKELNNQEYERFKLMYNKGIISKTELDKSYLDVLNSKNQLNTIKAELSQYDYNISSINKESLNYDLNDINKNIELKTEINNLIIQLKYEYKNWEEKYVIKSPIDGYINFFDIWKKNQFVNKGDVTFIINPSNYKNFKENLIGRVKIPLNRAGKIELGQEVNIKLTNYPYEEYGILRGYIKEISQTANNNFLYAKVFLTNGLTTSFNKEIENNNLVGQAEIITEDLTLIERIMYGLIKIFKQ